MATFRVTWSFKGGSGSVWSEVYYVDTTGAQFASQVSTATRNARLALLSPANTWLGSRAAQFQTPRVTGFTGINLPGTAPETFTESADTVGSSAIINLAGQTGGVRKLWLRGLTDGDIEHNGSSGADAPPANFIARLNTFLKQLQNDGYGLLQVSPRTVSGALSNIKILTVDGSLGNGTSVLTLALAPGYPSPSRIIIGGASAKDLPALNGRWSVISTLGTAVTIPYQTPQKQIISGGNAHARQEVYGATNVFSYVGSSFGYYGTRITKNVSTRSRGARRAQRIRTLA